MLKRSYVKISGLVFFSIGAVLISLAFFLPRLIDINAYRDDIIKILQQSLNRKVSFTTGEFSMHLGPTFTFRDVTVRESDNSADFLVAKRITIHLALLPLLDKKVVMRDVILDDSTIHLQRNSQGVLNIADMLESRPDSYRVHLKKFLVRQGTLHWKDMAVQPSGLAAAAENISFSMNGISRGHKGDFKLSFTSPSKTGEATMVSLSGTAKVPDAAPLSQTEFKASCELEQGDPGSFWPYYGKYIPFDNPGGRVDLATSFKGTIREFRAKGKLSIAGTAITWPTVFHHPVNPRLATLDYELKLTKDTLSLTSLNFAADGFKVKGSCQLQDITSNDLRIIAKASSEPFRLEGLRQWIPYGIIATDASEYIEEHITGGLFKLETGVLDGRISQILHMEKGTNYNVLHIKGTVEQGVVSYGKTVPTFGNIKAGLELLGKDFILSQASGTFGGSPFTMEGRITDYPLDVPCQYPFQMEMTPRQAEITWLSQFVRAQKLEFSGNSSLHLRGSGYIAAYQLSGDWELKQAAYAFPGAVRKPAGMQNHLAFSSILGRNESRLTSLTYTLPPLILSATAQFKYGTTPYFGFEVQTNQFLMGESLPLFTGWQAYHPRGKVQAHIYGSGNPEDFAAMDYKGAISLNSFSLLPGDDLRPVSNINGTINFKGSSLETSSIKVNFGSSAVTVQGRIKQFKNPTAEITLSSEQFFLRDIIAVPPKQDSSIRRLRATIAVRDNVYTIRSLSGSLNASTFIINGELVGGRDPHADVSIVSTNLDIDDLLLLSSASDQGAGAVKKPLPDLKVKLAVDAGKYGALDFSRLNATMSRDSGVVYLQKLDAHVYGGTIAAKGRIAPGDQGSRYDLNLNLARIQADHLLHALDLSREVTGTLSLQGDITARGATLEDVKKSALGNLRLRLEDGSLRKFNVLSKVFSILNFSQLLKFQLPDMVSGGMPYNEIKGSISVRDGITSTQDLFIRGDALNISMVGKADMVREELDFIIGVQPLQTVDKIVNRIPVVGWLLTGGDKAFLTAYFEAKGKWSDPQVKAIPVKSISKGVLNIFKRVFELPVRVFTDTGEVLLGQ